MMINGVGELSLEQVKKITDEWSYYSDARTLVATRLWKEIEDLTTKLEDVQKACMGDTLFYHDLHCNASRSKPMGCDECSCYMYQRARKAENG